MSLFYSKNFAPQGVNFFHYKNTEFDALYEKARNELNDNIKTELYQKMDQLVIDDAPIIPLYYDESVRLIQQNIKGLNTNPMNLLELKRVTKN